MCWVKDGSKNYQLTGPWLGWDSIGNTRYSHLIQLCTEQGLEIPQIIEPAAGDISTFYLILRWQEDRFDEDPFEFADSIDVAVHENKEIDGDAEWRYKIGRDQGDLVGTIAAGSTSANILINREQAKNAIEGKVILRPATEFKDISRGTAWVLVSESGVLYTPNNPAAKGRVSDILPGNFANIVLNEAQTVRYTYHHDAGGYAQAFLSVTARNLDSGETVTICRKQAVSVADGAQGSFTIPANALTMGRWTLAICAAPTASADYYGDTSDFWTTGEEVTYTVRLNPVTSAVECDGKPIPSVEWDAVAQAAYQVRFGDYDSGARTGSGETFTVPKIFRDGAYPVQVRSASSAGDWSAWTETEYAEIQNVPPSGDFSAEAVQEGTNAVIRWTAFSGAAHYAVFRDGVMIAVTDANAVQYVDRIGAGGEYEVLAVTAGRYYKSSGLLRFRLRLAADLISADGGYTWIACRLTPDRKSQPEDIREDMTFVYYAGSEKPAAFRSGQRERVKSFSYIFFSREPARRMRELLGREIIVKTTRGEHIRGTVADISWGDAKQPVVSFQVREVRGEEDGLEYPA